MGIYIGIDIGTTYIKGCVLNLKNKIIYDVVEVCSPERLNFGNNTYFEESPLEYFDKVLSLIEYFKNKYACKGILICCQLHCFLLCDKYMNQITNLITWQDTRASELNEFGESILDELNKKIGASFFKITGTNLKLGLPLCNLYHYIQKKSGRNEIVFCTLGSYINWRLTGNLVSHTTTAASTGLFDINSKTWSKDLISKLSFDFITFPEVIDKCVPIGNKDGLKVFVDVGDQQATIYGLAKVDEQTAIITIGTAGLVSSITKYINYGDYEIRPFFNGYYLNTVRRQIGGRNFDVLTDFIEEIGKYVFNVTIKNEDIYPMINTFVNNKNNICDDVTIEMKFFEGQVGVEHGRIDNINHDNLNLGSIFRAACRHTVTSYINAIKKLNIPDNQSIVISGKIINAIDYLKEQFILRLGNRVDIVHKNNESLYGLLNLAVDYERREVE